MTIPSTDMPLLSDAQERAPETAGYRVHFDVTPTGYRVSDPVPLPAGEDSQGDEVGDLVHAVKELLLVVREHPAGAGEREAFDAAQGSEKGMQ